MPTFTTFIQHNTGSPNQSNQERERKGHKLEKKKVKFPLFVNDMILYNTPKPKTIRANKFSKVQDTTHKSE